MNGKDINNIYFILTRTPEELSEWWETLSEDEQLYALEIVKAYREELDATACYDSEHIDTTEAKNYLKKFQLQK